MLLICLFALIFACFLSLALPCSSLPLLSLFLHFEFLPLSFLAFIAPFPHFAFWLFPAFPSLFPRVFRVSRSLAFPRISLAFSSFAHLFVTYVIRRKRSTCATPRRTWPIDWNACFSFWVRCTGKRKRGRKGKGRVRKREKEGRKGIEGSPAPVQHRSAHGHGLLLLLGTRREAGGGAGWRRGAQEWCRVERRGQRWREW